MNKPPLFLIGFILLWPAAARAENPPVATPAVKRPAAVANPDGEALARTNARRKKATDLIREADRLNTLYRQAPTGTGAAETRRLETKALIEAAREGDVSQTPRLADLVKTVRKDPELPQAKRCEIVALWSYHQADLGSFKKPEDRFAAIERVERSLIAEFPDAPNGYEALCRLAPYCEDARGQALAAELARSAKAPAFVKVEANKLLQRYALIGVAFRDLLPGGTNLPAVGGKPEEVAIYAWSSDERGSVAFAQFLKKNPPPGIRLIGVCLDRDEATGRAAAKAEGLDDLQLYDPAGALAARLKFDRVPQAYIAGADGSIRTVSGVLELTRSAKTKTQGAK